MIEYDYYSIMAMTETNAMNFILTNRQLTECLLSNGLFEVVQVDPLPAKVCHICQLPIFPVTMLTAIHLSMKLPLVLHL
jgi:hypothetical protein